MYLILTPKHNPLEDVPKGKAYQSLFVLDLKEFSEVLEEEGVIVYKIDSLTKINPQETRDE